jgi:hypothetical protein
MAAGRDMQLCLAVPVAAREPGENPAGLLAVHESVDDLCKKATGLCAPREVLGIAAASRVGVRAVTWENAIYALCMNRKRKLSTSLAAMARNYAEHLSQVYLTVIQARDRETWGCRDRVSPAPGGGRRARWQAQGPGRSGSLRRQAVLAGPGGTAGGPDRRWPTVTGPATRAATAVGEKAWRGEQIMIHQQRPVPLWGERAGIRSCWMCGIRMPADQMVADGGSACHDLRWYCRDTLGCTERWTSRSVRSAAILQEAAETPQAPGKQPAGEGAAQPVPA